MSGDDGSGSNTPKDFNKCVSQEKLHAVVDDAKKQMKEVVIKAVPDAIIDLKLGDIMDRV